MTKAFWSGRGGRCRAIAAAALAIAVGVMPPAAHALQPGQIVVVDETLPGVFLVDASSGNRQLISSATIGTGPQFSRPTVVVVEGDDSLLVGDANLEAIFRVNVLSGDRTVLTNAFSQLVGLALESDGEIVATDFGLDSVLRVDPVGGGVTIVSSASVGSGPAFGDVPVGIAVEASGTILVSEQETAAIFRVDPVTGDRTIISSASVGSGVPLSNPGKIVVEPDGNILVADGGVIRRVNPVTGDRDVVASPSSLSEFDVEESGDILVTVSAPSPGAVIRIDEPSGLETVVSSNGVGSGPNFVNTFGIANPRRTFSTDHFKCYQGRDLRNPAFRRLLCSQGTGLSTSDFVSSGCIDVRKVRFICGPVDLNGQGLHHPAEFLICYDAKGPKLSEPRPVVRMRTQIQESEVELIKPKLLCVPAALTAGP